MLEGKGSGWKIYCQPAFVDKRGGGKEAITHKIGANEDTNNLRKAMIPFLKELLL